MMIESPKAKAYVGALVAFLLGTLGQVAVALNEAGNFADFTASQWVSVAIAAVTTAGVALGVYGTTNA